MTSVLKDLADFPLCGNEVYSKLFRSIKPNSRSYHECVDGIYVGIVVSLVKTNHNAFAVYYVANNDTVFIVFVENGFETKTYHSNPEVITLLRICEYQFLGIDNYTERKQWIDNPTYNSFKPTHVKSARNF